MENIFSKPGNITIEPRGSYFETDSEGFLINPTSLEKIQPEWKPVINDVVAIYKEHCGDHLKNVYIRGSVAKGEALNGISDLDTFAYVDLTKENISDDWTKSSERALAAKYSFVAGVELDVNPISRAVKNPVLLNQSVCVFGDPIDVPKIKPGPELMRHVPNLKKRMDTFEKKMETVNSPEEVQSACTWFMKEMLRTGFELTMGKSGRYTRDLYLCYKDFSEYYPEKELKMKEILHYALNPLDNKEKLIEIKNEILPWMIGEAKKIIE